VSVKAPARELFTGEFLAQLERLALLSKRTFRGRIKGERKSPRKGSSVEFCDYRHYEVGDDLRYVDWNIAGRLDRLYVKLFVDEEDLCVHLLLDASASMDFGYPSKFGYGTRLAAALAFVGLVNLERVGVGVVRQRVAEGWLPCRGRNQFFPLLDFLGSLRPEGPTDLNGSLQDYALRAKEQGLAVLISDLLDPGGYEAGLQALRERRFDIHVIHLLSPEEMSPSFGGDLRLVDAETGENRELSLDGEVLRKYGQRLGAFLERAEGFCLANEINYHRLVTDVPLETFMLRHLKGTLLA
jgi:uncharacterized protein (DUF58 family)